VLRSVAVVHVPIHDQYTLAPVSRVNRVSRVSRVGRVSRVSRVSIISRGCGVVVVVLWCYG
jgi:hypothetical protein